MYVHLLFLLLMALTETYNKREINQHESSLYVTHLAKNTSFEGGLHVASDG